MRNLYLRACLLLYTLYFHLCIFADVVGDGDEEGNGIGRRGDSDMDMDMEGLDYSPISFSISDIVMVVLVLVLAYIFGKVWKGCSYLFIAAIAILYFLNKYMY